MKRTGRGRWKRWEAGLLAVLMLFLPFMRTGAEDLKNPSTAETVKVQSPEALLMEASSGEVLYEKDAHTRRSPASVTKIMTTLLAFEALEQGVITLDEEVVTSAHAKSMGGSQVFLEEGEKQTVDTLLKCILVSSGNDASVAMAEHIAGSEEEFVRRMNEKAGVLGMKDTHFVDCCGLTDSDDHYTSAYDIALMSRELITRFPQVYQYTTIWMENITHVTRQGTSEFGLSNTNKLLRSYDGCKGLKTGSTSKALFCISAVAIRNEVTLISVIMAGPDSKTRFADAAALLNYGFGKCSMYIDDEPLKLPVLTVRRGVEDQVTLSYEKEFRYLDTTGQGTGTIERELHLPQEAEAPIRKGDVAGQVIYKRNGKEIGSVNLLFGEDRERAGFWHYMKEAWEEYCIQEEIRLGRVLLPDAGYGPTVTNFILPKTGSLVILNVSEISSFRNEWGSLLEYRRNHGSFA